jgi:hypothetical protein
MRNFSVAEAFASGVSLIERKPRTVLVWGVAAFLIQLAPRLLAWARAGGGESLFPQPVLTPASAEQSQAVFHNVQLAYQSHGITEYLLVALWGLLGTAVLHAALYRSVLRPSDHGFAYLRVGRAEGRQVLLILWQILMFVIFFGVWLIAVTVLKAATRFLDGTWAPWVHGVGVLVSFAVFVWANLRFVLAGPMTFGENRLRFFSSWIVTRGQAWKLFWTAFLLGSLLIGVELLSLVALLTPLGVISGALKAGGFRVDASAFPSLGVAGSLIVLFIASVFFAALRALFLAPWATAYRALAGETE